MEAFDLDIKAWATGSYTDVDEYGNIPTGEVDFNVTVDEVRVAQYGTRIKFEADICDDRKEVHLNIYPTPVSLNIPWWKYAGTSRASCYRDPTQDEVIAQIKDGKFNQEIRNRCAYAQDNALFRRVLVSGDVDTKVNYLIQNIRSMQHQVEYLWGKR